MNNSIEEIYRYSGQYDKSVTLIFKHNSESYKTFGQSLTGVFIYTFKEREVLERRINGKLESHSYGYIKFKESLGNVDKNLQERLLTNGILSSDIDSILQFNIVEENLYAKKETKELPEPIKIKVDLSDWDDSLTLGLYQQYFKNGYDLCPFENDENIALLLMRLRDENPQKEQIINDFTDKETGKLKSSIGFEYLKKKFVANNGLTDEEKEDFDCLIKELAAQRADILAVELKKSTEKFKELGINYSDNLKKLIALTSSFNPERLTHNKKPVWWDYERFIHIYIRHVSEIQTGERFEEKTVFQYKFEDIRQLVINVLKTIENDIQAHFEQNPDKSFKRHGEMSVYYRGDYYVIDIAPNGRLMTFYKKE